MQNWTILKLIEWTADYFTKHGIPNPRLDAELLLAHTLNKKRIDLYLSFEQVVGGKDLVVFKGHIQRRVKREPLQYITGVCEFWGIPIRVTPAVLIPRPETELLVEKTLTLITNHQLPITILDLCTGSGAIISALASELPEARFTGIDISDAALEIARQNTVQWKDRVELMCGNLFEPLTLPLSPEGRGNGVRGKFDLITCNPPYVSESELATLQPEVRDFEPKEALVASEDGLAIIKRIINGAHKFLKPGGHLIMEIGNGQAEAVKNLISETGGYSEAETVKDYAGIERIVLTKSSAS